MSSSFGKIFKIQTFGESHGAACGVVIDGCPAGVELNLDFIQDQLDRRRPGQSKLTSERDEKDRLIVLSGIYENKTLGTPIAIVVNNENQNSTDYDNLKDVYRPSHADYVYDKKYDHRDHRGGGRSSARETLARVIGGAVAQQMLQSVTDFKVNSYVSKVGKVLCDVNYNKMDLSQIDSNLVRCPDDETANKMSAVIEKAKSNGDSLGGIVTCVIHNAPIGLGEPVFDKLHAELGKAMLSINAVKGFEIGSGFSGTDLLGSEHNDEFENTGSIQTSTNRSGGIQGGISNGEDIYFNVAFKPVASILKEQSTVNTKGETVTLKTKGRHDPCVLPRAVPIVDAMAWLVMADFYLRAKVNKL